MLLVLEDRYEPHLSTDTKKVPGALRLMPQWLLMTSESQKLDSTDFLLKVGQFFTFSPKILEKCEYTGSFMQIAAIFLN